MLVYCLVRTDLTA